MTAASFAVTDQCPAHLFRRGHHVVPEIRPRDYTKVTTGSLDSQALVQQLRNAPPMGRALRILLGLVLMVYTVPVYFQVPMRIAVGAWLLVLGLMEPASKAPPSAVAVWFTASALCQTTL